MKSKNKCPKCNEYLHYNTDGDIYCCLCHDTFNDVFGIKNGSFKEDK